MLLKEKMHRMFITYNEEIGHTYVPNICVRIQNNEYSYFVKTNSQGFRSNYDFKKKNSTTLKRVLFFGDSFTAGDGVNNEERFSDLVSNMLICESFNFALSGTGVDQQLLVFEKIAKDYDFDTLVISPHIQDIVRNVMNARVGIDRYTGTKILIPKPYFTIENNVLEIHNIPAPLERKPADQSKALSECLIKPRKNVSRLFYKYVPNKIQPFILKQYWRKQYNGYENRRSYRWKLMRALIERFIERSQGKPVVLFPLPYSRLFLNPKYENRFEEIVNDYKNVYFCDLKKKFESLSKNDSSKLEFKEGSHYSPFAHRLAAETLVDQLSELGFVKNKRVNHQNRSTSTGYRPNIRILGISAFYHDSACALIQNGEIVAAAQEERFSRKKHDPRFPYAAINYCLEEGRADVNDLKAVVFYDKAPLSLERIISSHLAAAPKGYDLWRSVLPRWLQKKLRIHEIIRKQLGYNNNIMHTTHHRSHAASAFFPSPFSEAAILTADGVGEWATASVGYGKENSIHLLKQLEYPHSIGLLYSAFTYFAGFKVNSGEYKLMGLAPYGEPRFSSLIKEHIVDIKRDGSIKLNLEYFGFIDRLCMINEQFEKLFKGPRRKPEDRITTRECDIARSIQDVIEEIMLNMAAYARALTGSKYLCLAGGVALNCVANGRILRECGFKDIWIQPAAGDAGGALGSALDIYYRISNHPRKYRKNKLSNQKGSLWGPKYSDEELLCFLKTRGYRFRKLDSRKRSKILAKYLADGKVIGHFSGRMEFGPRALGARSILADARSERTQSLLNLKIKFRESFRPFAPAVLEEDIGKYFEMDRPSPYMLLVTRVRTSRCLPMKFSEESDVIQIVNQKRSDIPAVTHVDYSARIQTINRRDHSKFYDLIRAFKKLTGCSVIVNTSFNVRGEPIVCTPEDAYRCFMRTEMDILVLENFLLIKEEQAKLKNDVDWRNKFVFEHKNPKVNNYKFVESQCKRLFHKYIVPLAKILDGNHIQIDGVFKESVKTYWRAAPQNGSNSKTELLPEVCGDNYPDNIVGYADKLLSHWTHFSDDQKKALKPLIVELIKLQTELVKCEPLLDDVVPDSIYVMF